MILDADKVVMLSQGIEYNIGKETTVMAATERVDKLEDEMKLLKVRDGTDTFSCKICVRHTAVPILLIATFPYYLRFSASSDTNRHLI